MMDREQVFWLISADGRVNDGYNPNTLMVVDLVISHVGPFKLLPSLALASEI